MELQKASPSRRASWNMLVRMMEREGFYDAENSENYRCMIKKYQKSLGELPSVEKHVNMVADSKLESIKELVGEISYEKRNNQQVLRELNKAKNELIDFVTVVEELKKSMEKISIETPVHKTFSHSNRKMLVLPSDWHIGYKTSTYNHEVAKERVNAYTDKVIEYAEIFGITDFHVIHMGDMIENLYMHKNTQAYNAEFTVAEQIVKATELLVNMLVKLSEKGNVIFHGVVRGNHGRMGKKGETIHNDCAEHIIHESVKSLLSLLRNENIVVDDSGYNIERVLTEINGTKVKATHGDLDGQNDRDKLQKHMSFENETIDMLALGHFHNYQVRTENYGRKVYGSGCLQGATDHGKTFKYGNTASQGIVVLGEDKEIIPIDISLEK